MKTRLKIRPKNPGFALIVTLSLMILLTIIAVGLLSLSSISLRSAGIGDAQARANANARLAVMLAIGELQKQTGDDRRITADASILDPSAVQVPPAKKPQSNLVGTWRSWSPKFAANPAKSAPGYAAEKDGENKFLGWLASSPTPKELLKTSWKDTQITGDWTKLFSLASDGFDLSAQRVKTPQGTFAWVVSQENTKAKVNIAGSDAPTVQKNAELQAQARPTLGLGTDLQQPVDGWNARAGKVISLRQVELDTQMAAAGVNTPALGASYTATSQGLLTDVVNGGLKTDLSLGFEMSDSDFAKDSWGETKNPFRSPNSILGFSAPGSYKGQQPLFSPTIENPVVNMQLNFDVAKVSYRFIAAGVPTFDHLRSFYRIPHHLYGSSELPTVAERGPDHIATVLPKTPPGGTYFSPANPPKGESSKTAIRPVLNRMIYLLSMGTTPDRKLRLILTPVVTLWNPYNTALEISGAIVYPWADIPFNIKARTKVGTTESQVFGNNASMMMGKQFIGIGHGRTINPYFFCEITLGGSGSTSEPIRLEPGQIRVFTPLNPIPQDFISSGTPMSRTVKLREVSGGTSLNRRGGFSIPLGGNALPAGATVQTEVTALNSAYPYFVSMEDSFRIGRNRNVSNANFESRDDPGGEPITEVQMIQLVSETTIVKSAFVTQADLLLNSPFGVIETYHRVARKGSGVASFSDLMYTTNPRQPSMNRELALGSFVEAPHFQSTLRGVASFDDAIQTTLQGEAFWGASHTADGSSKLAFFEIPREPMLSLAGFQHVDMASTTFSSANQFANSWASPYLGTNVTTVTSPKKVPIYDHSYLANEALWDSFFFSGLAPEMSPGRKVNPSDAWKNPLANESRSIEDGIAELIQNPQSDLLGNTRMRLNKRGMPDDKVRSQLSGAAGCTKIASHLMVDGAFNVNSTDVEAWTAVLAGMRGKSFDVEGSASSFDKATAFPRFRHPIGTMGNNWNGFRTLPDAQLRDLAKNIVAEVKLRGPFLSLAEFINRRVEGSALGKSGAIQSAINTTKLNDTSKQGAFPKLDLYPRDAQNHLINDTGVGIPGYLTQADVLQSLAPVITVRSDTFTVRGYGEAKDKNDKVIARAWCEAVVQRNPDFVDPSTPAEALTTVSSQNKTNKDFGRRFEIISFRRIAPSELQ